MPKRRERLHEHFRRVEAMERFAATLSETRVIDAMNDGDLKPLARFLWKHKTLTPRLAFHLGLFIRDPGHINDAKLQIVPKKPRRGRPPMHDPIEDEIARREVADIVANHERPGWGGAKSGIIAAEELLDMSRSTVNRHIQGRRDGARRRARANRPDK